MQELLGLNRSLSVAVMILRAHKEASEPSIFQPQVDSNDVLTLLQLVMVDLNIITKFSAELSSDIKRAGSVLETCSVHHKNPFAGITEQLNSAVSELSGILSRHLDAIRKYGPAILAEAVDVRTRKAA